MANKKIALKGYTFADGVHWHWNEKEIAIINERTSEVEWLVRKSSLPEAVIEAVYEKRPKASGKWLIETKRVRQSATQGEIHVTIDGKTIAVFGDDIKLDKNGNYESVISDQNLGRFACSAFWHKYDHVYRISDKAKRIFNPEWNKSDESLPIKESIRVQTPEGILYAYPSNDPEYPGIYIDLHKEGYRVDAPLALVEYSETERMPFPPKSDGVLTCKVWNHVAKEDPSDPIIFEDIDIFFSTED